MMNDFHTALFQANLLYGIELEEDDFEEYGLIAWKKIGNHRVRLYHQVVDINPSGNYIELPCNCEIVEAVTTQWEDWKYTSNLKMNGEYDTAHIELYIEARKMETDPLYVPGHYVKYERIGDRLYFHKNYGKVHILYYGSVIDDSGLPQLTDAEVDAIAAFVAYASMYKQGLATKNAGLINLAKQLKADWVLKCDLARIPEYINLNEMNLILDAKMCWNRKVYNRAFKPIM